MDSTAMDISMEQDVVEQHHEQQQPENQQPENQQPEQHQLEKQHDKELQQLHLEMKLEPDDINTLSNSNDTFTDHIQKNCEDIREAKQMLLIELVSQEPAIFNVKHKDYRKLYKKDELWLKISEKVGWTETYCKNKWKAIRDQYCRELKRTRTNPNLTIKWRYFKELDFLSPYALSRNYRTKTITPSNSDKQSTDQEESSTTNTPEGSIQTINSKENEILSSMKVEDWSICENSDQLTDCGDITSQIIMQLSEESLKKYELHTGEEEAMQEPQDDEDDDPIHTFLNIESYFEKELITLVSKSNVLYNFAHPSYRNTKAKLKIWEEIARKLKKTVRQCRLKWKALRDQFIREHKRLKNMDGGTNMPRWKHYDAMNFLSKYTKEKNENNITGSDKNETEIPNQNFEPEHMITLPGYDETQDLSQYILGTDDATLEFAECSYPKKDTEEQLTPACNPMETVQNFSIEEFKEETTETQPKNEESEDEVGAFFRAVAIKIRNAKMSTMDFTELQIDILRVITNTLKEKTQETPLPSFSTI